MAVVQIPDEPGHGRGIQWWGDTDPGAVGPGQVWFAPTAGVLSIRNDTDTGWDAIGGGGSTPNLGAVLAVGAAAGGVTITGLGAPSNPDDAARLADLPETPALATVLGVGADAGGIAITNLADPSSDQDAATKDYVDDAIAAIPPPTVASPLTGAAATNATGASVAFGDAAANVAGVGGITGGNTTGNNRHGGSVTLQGGTGDQGHVGGTLIVHGGEPADNDGNVSIANGDSTAVLKIGDGAGDNHKITRLYGQIVDINGRGGNNNIVMIGTHTGYGIAGQWLASDGSSGTEWLTPTVRNAASVPSAAPGVGELPFAVDTTADPGTLYFWDGAAWNQLV